LIRVVRKDDLTKKDNDKDRYKDKDNDNDIQRAPSKSDSRDFATFDQSDEET